MKTITKQTALRFVKQQLKHATTVSITLLTHKKDRQVTIEKQGDLFQITENGYKKENYTDLTEQAALKLLKKLLATEFPRSHQLYCQITSLRV